MNNYHTENGLIQTPNGVNKNLSDGERITYFAATHTRGKHRAFGIKKQDRDKHMYVIGKSGMGKSTMLENMAIQDIQNGEGLAFIDPHGSSAEKLLDFVPRERVKDVMYLAPFDVDNPIGFNIMEDVGYDQRHKVVAGLMGTFERIWKDTWSARMQYILQNTLLALLEYPGSTIIDVNRMLINKAFRNDVIKHISDPVISSFWKEEFANFTDTYTREATPAIQNKIGQFISNPLIRNIVGQPVSSFDAREMMDNKKILIINLSKGRMGEANASLLGSMLVIKLYLAALSRAEEPASVQAKLPPFYFYVDEFQSVVNDAFSNILSEARKYKLGLIIAHQYIEQMEEEVRNAVFGNVGTTVMFRVGPIDAEFLKTVFEPTFYADDMVNLGLGEIYLTLMIDGIGSQPFSAQTLPPIEEPAQSFRGDIIDHTREVYGRRRSSVEKAIREVNDRWQEAAKDKHKKDSAFGQTKGKTFSSGKKFIPNRQMAPRQDQSAEIQRAPAEKMRSEKRPEKLTPPPARHERKEKHESLRHKDNEHQNKEVKVKYEKNALKDAIKVATQNAPSEPLEKIQDKQEGTPFDKAQGKQEHERIVPPPIRHTQKQSFDKVQEEPNDKAQGKQPKNPRRDDIDPEMLRKILNGE